MDSEPEIPAEFAKIAGIINESLFFNKNLISFFFRAHTDKKLDVIRNQEKILVRLSQIIEYIVDEATQFELGNEPEDYGVDEIINELRGLVYMAIIEMPGIRKYIKMLTEDRRKVLDRTTVEISTSDLIRGIFSSNRKLSIIKRIPQASPPPTRQQIDGVWLTDNEEIFEEYCIEHFNEKWWMKKHRLTLAQIKKTDQT